MTLSVNNSIHMLISDNVAITENYDITDLIDRLSGKAVGNIPPRPNISIQRFIGTQRLYALNSITGSEVVQEFDLQGEELSQSQQIKNNIDSLGTPVEKFAYISKIEAVAYCVMDYSDTMFHISSEVVDKVRVFSILSIS